MKVLIYILITATLTSCGSLKTVEAPITGTFVKEGRNLGFNYAYKVELREDGTFYLEERLQDAKPKCSGRWTANSVNCIRLQCDSLLNLNELLSNGYMSTRDQMVKVLTRNRLLYKKVVLKRVK